MYLYFDDIVSEYIDLILNHTNVINILILPAAEWKGQLLPK